MASFDGVCSSGLSITLLPSCLPLLHGHYPASLLLWRLCHLPGRFFGPLGHERRSFPRIVIPDLRHSSFLPFHLQTPHPFPPPRSLSLRNRGRRSRLALLGTAFGSWLRRDREGSPMDRAESSSSWWCLWTGSSPRVALHPVSRRRSYLRLRTASALSEGDFHPSAGVRFQAHSVAPAGACIAFAALTPGLKPMGYFRLALRDF